MPGSGSDDPHHRRTEHLVGGTVAAIAWRWLLVVVVGLVAAALCFPAAMLGAGSALRAIGEIEWYVLLGMLLVAGFAGLRYLLRLPRVIYAECSDDEGTETITDLGGSERWTGIVRGFGDAEREMRVARRMLHNRGTPAQANSPLSPLF